MALTYRNTRALSMSQSKILAKVKMLFLKPSDARRVLHELHLSPDHASIQYDIIERALHWEALWGSLISPDYDASWAQLKAIASRASKQSGRIRLRLQFRLRFYDASDPSRIEMLVTADLAGWSAQFRDTQAEVTWEHFALIPPSGAHFDNSHIADKVRRELSMSESEIADALIKLKIPDTFTAQGSIIWPKILSQHLLLLPDPNAPEELSPPNTPTLNSTLPPLTPFSNTTSSSSSESDEIAPGFRLNVTGLHDISLAPGT